jgi:uncharacterized protein involved in tellurium resistance
MILDPASAPPRSDLSFLRRRSRPKPTPTDTALADFIAGRAVHPTRHRAAQSTPTPPTPAPAGRATAGSAPTTSSGPPVSFARPSSSPSPLDLSSPTPSPAAAPPPASASSSLDLSGPATPPPPAPPSPPAPVARPASDALDLSDAPAAAPRAAVPRQAATPAVRVHDDVRIRAGQHRLLSIKDPTVTLTRVQSGIGLIEIEAVCSPELGDLRLGAAYQLRGGASSTVQYSGGNRFAPSSRRPVVVAGRDEYEHLRIDLRQARELERLAVYAFSESRTELTWAGTLVVTTFGGARVELPLESLYPGKVAVLISIYNFDGEFVIRAEMETITGDVREAARAYGYDRITWRDDRTPVD